MDARGSPAAAPPPTRSWRCCPAPPALDGAHVAPRARRKGRCRPRGRRAALRLRADDAAASGAPLGAGAPGRHLFEGSSPEVVTALLGGDGSRVRPTSLRGSKRWSARPARRTDDPARRRGPRTSLVLLIGLALRAALRRCSPALRHAVLAAAIIAAPVVGLIGAVTPGVSVPTGLVGARQAAIVAPAGCCSTGATQTDVTAVPPPDRRLAPDSRSPPA